MRCVINCRLEIWRLFSKCDELRSWKLKSRNLLEETKTNTAAHGDFTTRWTSSGESQRVKKGTRGVKIPGLVKGTPLEFQIDTGAINTFITEDTYYSILP